MNTHPDSQPLLHRSPGSMSLWVWVAICLSAASFVTVIAIMILTEGSSAPVDWAPAGVSRRAATSGNPTHDKLLGLSDQDQALVLGSIVRESCTGITAFYMGIDKDNTAFWSVDCENGKAYSLSIQADIDGSARVLGCDVLLVVTKLDCFNPFEGPQ